MIRLQLEPRTFHFHKPAATSRGPLVERAVLLVHATDPARPGRAGLGECGPIPNLSIDSGPNWQALCIALAASIDAAGLQLRDADDPLQAAAAALAPFEAALAAAPSFRFALESALCGLLADAGGSLWPSAFAQGAPLPTHGLLWMEDAAGLLEQAAAKVEAGFAVLKLKVGALPLDEELALLETLRARDPHVGLRLDANGAFLPEAAAALLERLAPLGIEFLEQPVAPSARAALLELAKESPVALAVDESLIALTQAERCELLCALAAGARVPPVAILKPGLLGGCGPALELSDLCDELAMPWVVNSLLEAAPGHATICQWTAWRLEQASGALRYPVQALGSGGLFADNLPSPIALDGPALVWRGVVV